MIGAYAAGNQADIQSSGLPDSDGGLRHSSFLDDGHEDPRERFVASLLSAVPPQPLKPGVPMSDITLTRLLRSTGLSERATVHGFRSSFKNWTLEQTDTPLGRIGGGSCPYPGQLHGTGIRQVRSIRAPPGTDAAVGGLSYRLSSREVESRVQVNRHRGAGLRH